MKTETVLVRDMDALADLMNYWLDNEKEMKERSETWQGEAWVEKLAEEARYILRQI